MMNKKKTRSLPHLCILLVGMAALWPHLAGAQLRPFAHEASDLPPDASVEFGVMDNGIRYAIMPWSEPPGRLSVRLLVEAGSYHETERQKGLAHLIEHMAFNGTRHFSAGEMVEYFQRLGMAFGPDTNAHTGFKETVYKLELPEAGGEVLEQGLLLLRDYADGMLLETEEIEKEKGVVLSELRDRDTPGYRAFVDEMEFSLPQARISGRMPIGDADVIRMATRQDLVDFYEKWYTPDRMVLVGVGDLEPEELLGKFREYFGDMEAVEASVPDPDPGALEPVDRRARLYSNAELGADEAGIYCRRRIEPVVDTLADRLERERMQLANAMMSRRFERLSKEAGVPLTGGQAYDYRWMQFARFTGLSLDTRSETWREALKLGTRELKKARQYGFSEAEFAEARANRLNALEESARRASTRKSRNLSSALVRSIRGDKVFMDPQTQRDLMVPELEALSVEDAESSFVEAWEPEERLIYIKGNFARPVEAAFAEAQAVEVEPPDLAAVAEFGYTDFGEPADIVREETAEDLGIRQLVLSNGVRLNLKQTDFEANTIRIGISFGHGNLLEPPQQPGLSFFADNTFLAGGLGKHSADELKQLTAGRTVSTGFGVEGDYFRMTGTTNEEDLLLQLQILAAYLSDPGYRPEARRVLLRQLDGLYTRLQSDPMMVLQDRVEKALSGGDPRFGFPERADLEARTLDELAAWMDPALREGYLEVAVVGDFGSEEAVVEAVSRTLGALPRRSGRYVVREGARDVTIPQTLESREFRYTTQSNRALTTVNWPTTGQVDIKEVRRLSLLASVVSDRMRVRIREEIGEAYSPYAYNRSSEVYPEFGYLRALVGVDPEMSGTIEDILMDIAADLRENGVGEDELVRAVEPVKNRIEEYRRTNGYWLNSVLQRAQSQPERLEWARSFADFWDTVTVEELDRLAERYLLEEAAIPVRVLPRS